ncbi:molybdenum cofactor guanylyltransferase [Demequina sp. SYSU T00068]|uniref:molybdenum cofactor guanylyltransferase n=1 Tax=Demequina lignilytica TaxID=3051663 RepID=UPI0026256262|nr:molybdenum cofactor guanylyltransferase [Demequina sp. SYSU T00068]MDN4489774.1 molybdenum cofactor guanylyltransferase [Demequina sp. SYSU T00068]
MRDAARASIAAIVPAGGRARRFGSDKTLASIGGATLVGRAVDACRAAGAEPIVVVGPPENAVPGTVGAWEEPPFGGPVAAIAAGLSRLDEADLVAVVAADMPFAGDALAVLVAAIASSDGIDGACAVDTEGRRQPLLAVYRTRALSDALAALGEPAGAAMRALTRSMTLVEVPCGAAAIDIDTPEALARAGGEAP